MRLADFDYTLPPDLIAQQPASPRDSSRLLVVERASGALAHRAFREIEDYVNPGDVLVLNDTRVIRARLRGRRPDTGGRVEVFLLRPQAGDAWVALVRPGRRLRAGSAVDVGPSAIRLEIGERLSGGLRVVRRSDGGEMAALLEEAGEMPLPPYIHRPLDDPDQYQTVYAREDGAVAAPTAGLHFTPELLDRMRSRGVQVVALTLHVGLGTFQPVVEEEDVRRHRMDAEHYAITDEAAGAINARRGRLIAVGTTTVRALETAAAPGGDITPGAGWTDLFIVPGYRFGAVQAMVTNFHLPKTTLLLLVSAFAGRETIRRAYDEAIARRYRFYSFGDAMLIL